MFVATSQASGDGNQGSEMTVPVTELKGLDTAGAGRHGFVERVGFRKRRKRARPLLFPHAVSALNRGAEKAPRAR